MTIALTPDVVQPSLLDGEPPHGGPTLEDVVSSVWEGLAAHRTAACPVCHGAMVPRYGSGAAAVGGSCRHCGATLS